MLTVQRTAVAGVCVTINAPFLQEIKEANSLVWERLFHLRLESRMDYPSDKKIRQWVQNLTDFRKLLSTEFALEETYGYISNAARQHIFTGIDPAETLKQHKELYLQLVDICDHAEQAVYSGTVVRDFRIHVAAFQEFDAMLSQHEKAESQMIYFGLGRKV